MLLVAGVRRGVPGLLRRRPGGHPAAALTRPVDSRPGRSAHYRARWVTPPLVARPSPPTRVARPKEAPACLPILPSRRLAPSSTASTSSSSAPSTSRSSSATTPRPACKAIVAIHSTALGPGPRRHPLLPLRHDRRRGPRRPQPLARDVLQGRAGRPRPRRRQGRDHRRPGDATRPRRCCAPTAASCSRSTAATTPPATSAPTPTTWTSSPASAPSSPAAPSPTVAPATRRCSRRTASTRACGPAPRRSGAPRRWPAAPSASPASARSAATWSGTSSRTARGRGRHRRLPAGGRRDGRGEYPSVTAVADDRRAGRAPSIDVYAPCAMGGALTDEVVDVLTAKIVCGAANNQLAHPGIEKALADRGILYAPDYCVNSGGLIQVADELEGFSFERAQQRASRIFDTTTRGLRAGPRRRASRPPRPPTGSPSAGCATSAACAGSGSRAEPRRPAARGARAALTPGASARAVRRRRRRPGDRRASASAVSRDDGSA